MSFIRKKRENTFCKRSEFAKNEKPHFFNVQNSQKSRKKPQLILKIIDICESHLFEDDIFMIFLVWQILPTLYRVKKSHFVTIRLKIFFHKIGFDFIKYSISVL